MKRNILKITRGQMLNVLAAVVTLALMAFGKHEEGAGMMAVAGVITLSETDKAGFNGDELKMISAVEKLSNQVLEKSRAGLISPDELKAYTNGVIETLKNDEIKALNSELKRLEDVAKTQGISMQELSLKLSTAGKGFKSVGEVLKENEEEIRKVYNAGSGAKTFMAHITPKGDVVMVPYDVTKAAGPHATIGGIGGGGNVTSVTQSIDAATLLRMGGTSPIVSNYRNDAWVFDLVNTIQAGYDMPYAMWYEEKAKQGAAAVVAEGGTKPLVQYAYEIKTAQYKKVAALLSFTDEFSLDFPRLQDEIMNKGRIDVINGINQAVLADITTAATAYNTSAAFNGGVAIATPNNFDVIAAMAAQVDSVTFGTQANAAVMSTYKKYNMGITKDTTGNYLNRPEILNGLSFIGNPDMGTDDVLVGDFKAMNVILRGGFIVKIGYNGTDFAENRFSVVMEQFYYDYISTIKKAAIVKGPTFAAVKTAIGTV